MPPLHVDFRTYEADPAAALVLNNMPEAAWLEEGRPGLKPDSFKDGQPFLLRIFVAEQEFVVSVDGREEGGRGREGVCV